METSWSYKEFNFPPNFNDRWFSRWDATPDDKRQLFYTFTESIKKHPDYQAKYVNNPDSYTRELAYKKIFDEVAYALRKLHLEFSKELTDEHFKQDFRTSTQRYLRWVYLVTPYLNGRLLLLKEFLHFKGI